MAANRCLILLILVMSTGAAAADRKPAPPDRKPAPPDPDMLEFLGTFETAGGKDVDPFLLKGDTAAGLPAGKSTNGKPAVRQKSGRKIPPKERNINDE
jgi:hypothetical protein